ncbi:MAG TPA: class I tRNA ligase family protein, partial [Candidatus Saccharimonadales bacterium]|nr:class I tRNA ligase family protein [Candidatus Saccharimonadales bacterium]
MRLYNTLTRQIEELTPLNPPALTIYTCGPTVYDYAHVGHWFTYVRMDTLVRALKAAGFKTDWVMNITDVGHLVSDADEGEDKLERGARREGKTAWEVAEFYTEDFLNGMRQLNMLKPNHLVKATKHIKEQVALIKELEEKGFIYVIDDGVYYDTGKFPRYADFARLDLDEQQAGARVS